MQVVLGVQPEAKQIPVQITSPPPVRTHTHTILRTAPPPAKVAKPAPPPLAIEDEPPEHAAPLRLVFGGGFV